MLDTHPTGQLERCPRCFGTLKVIPEPDTGLLEAKCLQCGRVAYDRPDPTATTGGRLALDELPERPGRNGAESVTSDAVISLSPAAGRQMYRLLTANGSSMDHVFRLEGKTGNVSLGVGVMSRDDIVLFHRGRAVLAVNEKIAQQIGDATVVVRRRNGRTLVVLARPRRAGVSGRSGSSVGGTAEKRDWRDLAMEAS